MTRIAHARSLARVIRATIDSLPTYAASQEVERVYAGAWLGLVDALNNGWISQVTEEGLAELVRLADELLGENFRTGQELVATVTEGTVLEVTDYETQARILVRVTGWSTPGQVATILHLSDPFTGKTDKLNLFWNYANAKRLAVN